MSDTLKSHGTERVHETPETCRGPSQAPVTEEGVHTGTAQRKYRQNVHLVRENGVARESIDRTEDRQVTKHVLGTGQGRGGRVEDVRVKET